VKKLAVAEMTTRAGVPLTLNAVIHRGYLHQVGAFIVTRRAAAATS
jgi:hypothetical protein